VGLPSLDVAQVTESTVPRPPFDPYWVVQSTIHSVGTLSVVIDSFQRSVDEMYSWPYEDKHEMKYLGGTLIQMNEKFIEFVVLGASKIVEDAFNLLEPVSPPKLKIWSPIVTPLKFANEVRWLRHVGNVIKHYNSHVDISTAVPNQKHNSCVSLVRDFAAPDDTPVAYLPQLRDRPIRDALLKHLYYSYVFSFELMFLVGHGWRHIHDIPDADIPAYMLDRFVRDIPGHPERAK
jgi:hypothetical protein